MLLLSIIRIRSTRDAMKPIFRNFSRSAGKFLPGFLVLTGLVVTILMVTSHPVVALPEYATRTGESCSACHVSAGGGGPRTLRGLLWAAQGKPDKVPSLPGMLIAPRVTDDVELYQIACSGCHGNKGEGLSAMGLVNTKINQPAIRSFLEKGIPKLGMPSFQGQFTQDQMDILIPYVAGLASGEIPPPPDSYPLSHPFLTCGPAADNPVCIHPFIESRGN